MEMSADACGVCGDTGDTSDHVSETMRRITGWNNNYESDGSQGITCASLP